MKIFANDTMGRVDNIMVNKRVFAVTVPGANHLEKGKECQDYSLAVHGDKYFYETCIGKENTWERKKQPLIKPKPFCCMAIVADGHGGDAYFRSAKGSQFAAESARNRIAEFLRIQKKQPTEPEVKQLVRSVIKTWNDRVQDAKPFGNSELSVLPEEDKARYLAGEDPRHAYGTTLIAAVMCDNYWFGFHIGDGRCTVLNNDGSFSQPIPWDDRCFLNKTSSICDDDAAERARVYIASDKPIGIFVCSDGIEDCYPVNENDKYLAKFYHALAVSFAEQDFDAVYADIKETLPIMSKKGSGDDMSLAGIFDETALKHLFSKRDMANQKKEAPIRDTVAAIEEKASQKYSETTEEQGKNVNITV